MTCLWFVSVHKESPFHCEDSEVIEGQVKVQQTLVQRSQIRKQGDDVGLRNTL